MASRQEKANREIAQMLQWSEFKNEDYYWILENVRAGTIHNIGK